MNDDELDVVSEERVDEFDVGTCIMVMTDGTARLRFGLMPPSWRHRDGAFERIIEDLEQVLGVAVEGLDKEFFGIASSDPSTLARLRGWLLERRRELELR